MATNYASASYSEVFDLHTEVGNATVIGIHTPQTDVPQKMLGGFFTQFRKFRYIGCDVTLIPVSTLPADPLQVSYEAGEPTIDPRDMVNPILYKGCHGNDLGLILNTMIPYGLTGSSPGLTSAGEAAIDNPTTSLDVALASPDSINFNASDLELLYYQGLSDTSWNKAHVQRGFRKSGLYPMVYDLATDTQIGNGKEANPNYFVDGESAYTGSVALGNAPGSRIGNNMTFGTTGVARQFSSGLSRLGWLDTTVPTWSSAPAAIPNQSGSRVAGIPKLMMMVIMMPPAYKTEFYFRMVLKHKFEFKRFANAVGPDARFSNQLLPMEYADVPAPVVATASVTSQGDTVAESGTLDVVHGSVTSVTSGVS